MNEFILEEARKFLVKHINGKVSLYETKYPWKKDWEFCLHHSFRVEKYILKIVKAKEYNLLMRIF